MAGRTARAVTIDEVCARFENGRRNRKGKGAIPDELWSAAVEVARTSATDTTQFYRTSGITHKSRHRMAKSE